MAHEMIFASNGVVFCQLNNDGLRVGQRLRRDMQCTHHNLVDRTGIMSDDTNNNENIYREARQERKGSPTIFLGALRGLGGAYFHIRRDFILCICLVDSVLTAPCYAMDMNNEPLPQLQRPRAFVVRVVHDGQGNLHGQISEPSSADEWRATFTGAAELWRIFAARLDAATGIASTVVFDDERNVL